MKFKSYRRTAILVAAAVGTTAFLAAVPATAQAADSDIVISEIMYHAPDPDITEFIELANKGSAAVDISGWSFLAGITINTADGKFPSGTTIPAHGRIVGTGDDASFVSRYGFSADFNYGVGGINGTNGTALSNGGEEIKLVNASAAVVDDLTYDDVVPWPLSPDGVAPGTSLELTDLNADNSLAASWAASLVPYGTPRQLNSVEATPPLTITDVGTSPAAPSPNTAFTVNATVAPGAAATLTYKVMFDSDVTIPMADDAGSAGGSGDGTFSATVPGAGAGQLVRYKIDATANSQSVSSPAVGDSENYNGVVVTDPALANAKFPVLQWFMTDADYNDMLANHRCDDVSAPAIVAWGSQVFDNSAMSIHGQSTCTDAKVKWEMNMPQGHLINLGAPFNYPMDEFRLNTESTPVPGLGWKMIDEAGDPPLSYEMVRTQRNGQFYSVVALLEKYDNVWRAQHGYNNGTLYKVDAGGLRTYSTPAAMAASLDLEKKNPDDGDFTDVWQLTQMLSQPDSPAKRAWMYDNLDLSQMANYTALTVAMRHWDSGGKNFDLAKENGSGRWQILSWDLDGILSGGSDSKGDFVIPDTSFNKLYKSLFAIPEFRAMHFRRLKTLTDQYITGNGLLTQFDAWTTCCASDIALDVAAWKTPSLAKSRTRVINGVQERRNQIAAHSNATEIPASQSVNPNIVINEIQYAPIPDGNAEYLELYNPSATESVDLSGWLLQGVGDYQIPAGTVLLPQGYGVVVSDDAAFKAAYGSGKYVIGQYSGHLDNAGDTLTLLDGIRTVDTVTYTPTAPWPVEANGTGPSLELNNPTLDNSDPASWHASSNSGTPDATNTGGGGSTQTVVLPFGSSWKYLATGPDQGTAWRASAFNDTSWTSGTGDLGFKNANHTTIPSTTGRVTYYFRTHVNLSAGNPVTALDLSLLRDDGAVVYINGVEVARSNMPTGTITFTKKATVSTDGAAETTPVAISLPTGALTTGDNVVAVEVHQKATGAAGDLTMDAQLTVTR